MLFLKNNTNPQPQIDHAKQWLIKNIPTTFTFEEQDAHLNILFSEFKKDNGKVMLGLSGVKEQARQIVPQGKYDIVVFIYDLDNYIRPEGEVYNWTTWSPLFIGTQWCEVHNTPMDQVVNQGYTDTWTYCSIVHEMHHAFCEIAFGQGWSSGDEMDTTLVNGVFVKYSINNPDSFDPNCNFVHTLNNLRPYLNSLNAMEPYKYFKFKESTGGGHIVSELNPELMKVLDMARGFAGVPFQITSGYRTPQENTAVGGVAKSTHMDRNAVDIHCTDQTRYQIITGALKAGFTRIGIYKDHLHLDIGKAPDYVQNVCWYSDKD